MYLLMLLYGMVRAVLEITFLLMGMLVYFVGAVVSDVGCGGGNGVWTIVGNCNGCGYGCLYFT